MTNLKSRITRLEKRIGVDESKPLTLMEIYHEWWASDPEGFRREAMEPHRCSLMMQGVMTSPTPRRVLRRLARQQAGKERS